MDGYGSRVRRYTVFHAKHASGLLLELSLLRLSRILGQRSKGELVTKFSSSRATRVAIWGNFMVLALILSLAGVAGAQKQTGSLSGSVNDPSGALVPDVDITVTNTGTAEQSRTKSDSSGVFRISSLPIGNYNVEFGKEGFKKLIFSQVTVSAG